MNVRTCQICGYTQAPEKQKCPACGYPVKPNIREGDEISNALKWEARMIQQIKAIYPVGMAPAGSTPRDPMSLSIVIALKDSPFGDDVDRFAKALAAKSYLMLRIAKIRAGEAGANAIYDYRLQLAYGGENTILAAYDKELLILFATFTPIIIPR